MILKDLLKGIECNISAQDELLLDIQMISCDSREKQSKALFVAIDGFKVRGESFIEQAIDQGAIAIAKKGSSRQIGDYIIPSDIAVIDVENTKEFLKVVTLRFYDNPSSKLDVIGVTGTNGKTTITYLLESIIKANQQESAVIGTVNYRIASNIIPSKNTTPGFLDNQRMLNQLVNLRTPYCLMEVSSHALDQGRVDGINFKGAIFTNLTQDHLDYHQDMDSYFNAKSILFKNLSSNSWSIINKDDSKSKDLLEISKGKRYTFSVDSTADFYAKEISYSLKGTAFDIVFPAGKINILTSFIGRHNVYNILAAFSAAYAQGIKAEIIKAGIESIQYVPGRLQRVDQGQGFYVFIDYAHTEDGLINVLEALKRVSHNKLILVFGCGGDRDKGKRRKMGMAACRLADYSIVTSDNPRTEDPESIINEITSGYSKENFEVIVDRKTAIHQAIKMAGKGETILIAGKGHEDYQILKDRVIPFNEEVIVSDFIKEIGRI